MKKRRPLPLRRWLRALHRDVGYLAVGLTFVYAMSGIAVNHLEDWDPNFNNYESSMQLDADVVTALQKGAEHAGHEQASAQRIMQALGQNEPINDVYEIEPGKLDITVGASTYFVDLRSGVVRQQGQKPRLVLRAANWLHLNRGKKAWTWIADGYAVFLLFLATSGLFMIKGRQGLLGRGALLTLIGAAVPVLYVSLSGGP